MTITIDDAMAQLQDAKDHSPLAGNTVLVVSLADSGIELLDIEALVLIPDDNGAVVEVWSTLPGGDHATV